MSPERVAAAIDGTGGLQLDCDAEAVYEFPQFFFEGPGLEGQVSYKLCWRRATSSSLSPASWRARGGEAKAGKLASFVEATGI